MLNWYKRGVSVSFGLLSLNCNLRIIAILALDIDKTSIAYCAPPPSVSVCRTLVAAYCNIVPGIYLI